MVFELDNDGVGDSDGSGALTTSYCRWRWFWLDGLVIGGCGLMVDMTSWWEVGGGHRRGDEVLVISNLVIDV